MKIRRSMLERVLREELKNILAEKALLSEITELTEDNDLDSSEDVVAEPVEKPATTKVDPVTVKPAEVEVGDVKVAPPAAEDIKLTARTSALDAIAAATQQGSIKPLDVATMRSNFEANLPEISMIRGPETEGERDNRMVQFDSYVSGGNRKAWIRRLSTEVFAKGTDPKIIEAHYDNIVLPGALNAISTPTIEGRPDVVKFADNLSPDHMAKMRARLKAARPSASKWEIDDKLRSMIMSGKDALSMKAREHASTTTRGAQYMPGTKDIFSGEMDPSEFEEGVGGHERQHKVDDQTLTMGEKGTESEIYKYYEENGMLNPNLGGLASGDEVASSLIDADGDGAYDQPIDWQSQEQSATFDEIWDRDKLPVHAKDTGAGHASQTEYYANIITAIRLADGEFNQDNVFEFITGQGPFENQGNDFDELIDSFSPSSRAKGEHWSGSKLQPEIQTVVDDFYGLADQTLKSLNPDIYKKVARFGGQTSVSTPEQLGKLVNNLPEFKEQLLGSEEGKAFMNTLNSLSTSLNKFARVEVPTAPEPAKSYKDTLKDLQPAGSNYGERVAESKKKGSEMEILFEGWRKFIE